MHGTATIIRPGVDGVETVNISKYDARRLAIFFHEAVDGYIEAVPNFSNYNGQRCVAFVNEDGHRLELAPNYFATSLWGASIANDGFVPVTMTARELLLGSVVIVTGDAEFMAAL